MKLNNKGITLVEIIISVALISIVLVFLFTMLIQVNNENSDNEIKSSYLINQAAYIKLLEEDFLDYNLNIGKTCSEADISNIEEGGTGLVLPKMYIEADNPDDIKDDEINTAIGEIKDKCLKFKYTVLDGENYLFIYKRKLEHPEDSEKPYEYVLSYYRADGFKQSVALEDYDDSGRNVKEIDSVTYSSYSLPITGPDGNDYSINLSYAK